MYQYKFKAYDKDGDVVNEMDVITIVERGDDNNFYLKVYHVNGKPISFEEVKNEAN